MEDNQQFNKVKATWSMGLWDWRATGPAHSYRGCAMQGLLGGGACSSAGIIDPNDRDLVSAQAHLSREREGSDEVATDYVGHIQQCVKSGYSAEPYISELERIQVPELSRPFLLAIQLANTLLLDQLWENIHYYHQRSQLLTVFRKVVILHHMRNAGGDDRFFHEMHANFFENLKLLYKKVQAQDRDFPESGLLAEFSVLLAILYQPEKGSSRVLTWTKIVARVISAACNKDWKDIAELLEIIVEQQSATFPMIGLLTLTDYLADKYANKVLSVLLQPAVHSSWRTIVITLNYVERLILQKKLKVEKWLPNFEAIASFHNILRSERVREKAVVLLTLIGHTQFLEQLQSKEAAPRVLQLLANDNKLLKIYTLSIADRLARTPVPSLKFMGNEDIIHEIETNISQGPVVLIGPPGAGKTNIAAKFVNNFKELYQNVIWVDTDSKHSVLTSLKRCGLAMGLEETNPDVLLKCIQYRLQSSRHLVVFDRVQQDADILSQFKEPSHILITTQVQQWPPEYFQVCVNPMDQDTALVLFETNAQRPPEIPIVPTILESVSFNPFGIMQVCAYLKQRPEQSFEYYLHCLEKELFLVEDSPSQGAVAAAQLVLQTLSGSTAEKLLHLASVVDPVRISSHVCQAALSVYLEKEVTDCEMRSARHLLDCLSLVTLGPDNEISVHSLVADISIPTDRESAVHAWANALNCALEEIHTLPDQTTQFEAFAKVERQAYSLTKTAYYEVTGVAEMAVQFFYWKVRLLGDKTDPGIDELLDCLSDMQPSDTLLVSLGGLLKKKDRLKEARKCYNQAFELRRSNSSYYDVSALKVLSKLGTLLEAEGKRGKALGYLHQALPICFRTLGKMHCSTAKLLYKIGTLTQAQGRFDAAIDYFNQSLLIARPLLGDSHLLTARSLNRIALIFQAQGRVSEALDYFNRVLPVYEDKLGSHHYATADLCYNMGLAFELQRHLSDAIKCYDRALQSYQCMHGDEHVAVANTHQNLAVTFQMQHDFDSALHHYFSARSIYHKTLGRESVPFADALLGVGTVYKLKKELTEAKAYIGQALTIYRNKLGSDHLSVGHALHNLAGVATAEEEFEDALNYYDQAIMIYRRKLDPCHPMVARTFHNVATVFSKQGRFEFALNYYEKALNIFKQQLGSDKFVIAHTLYNIAHVLEQQGQGEEALRYYNQGLNCLQSKLENKDFSVLDTVNNNVLNLQIESRLKHARENYQKYFAMHLNPPGKSDNVAKHSNPEEPKAFPE